MQKGSPTLYIIKTIPACIFNTSCSYMGALDGGVLILRVDFKKAHCHPVEFKKCSCRHVEFKKCSCPMSISF